MKIAILAGGRGARLAEETDVVPKPMVEIGGKPILWHIIQIYGHFGFREFAIALGYKGEVIKKYFVDNERQHGNSSVACGPGDVSYLDVPHQERTVELIDTGEDTETGGRIKRLLPCLGDGTFMLTWADGVADIDIRRLLDFHQSHGRLATVTAVRPPARFGRLTLEGERVVKFAEKQRSEEGWINGAFFVLEPGVFDYIEGDDTSWEMHVLDRLARDGQLMAYRHDGFWQCMDTLHEKHLLEKLWQRGEAPWKVWSD